MSTAIIRGIVLSISIVTALGIAVLENPQVQQWLEEQRQKIAELLRSIGEDLDPQSRREAEAFAFEGRTPATDAALRREAIGSRAAVATATGSSLTTGCSSPTVRRIPIQGTTSPKEAEDRRRKGKEYLAQRQQQMYELQQRRQSKPIDAASTTTVNASFDALVDEDGKLKAEQEIPSPPLVDPVATHLPFGTREMEHSLAQPLLADQVTSSSAATGWQMGSTMANPFGDEYAMDRSVTPRPPTVPPKIALEPDNTSTVPPTLNSFASGTVQAEDQRHTQSLEEMSYEEQLAIALSLSEAEGASSSSPRADMADEDSDDDVDLKAAIQASLRDRESATQVPYPQVEAHQDVPSQPAPLVDLTQSALRPSAPQPRRTSNFEALFASSLGPDQNLQPASPPAQQIDEDDELYRITPELTRARLASLEDAPNEQTREGPNAATQSMTETSFESVPSTMQSAIDTSTARTALQPLVDTSDETRETAAQGSRTPTTHTMSPTGFESDSDSDTFASMSAGPVSRASSRPRSDFSAIEVVDVAEDSDVDMLSEEGDGVATPDSWTEVGSRDGDSETDDEAATGSRRQIR